MGIFDNNNLTPAQLAAQQVIQITKQQFSQLAQSGMRGYNLIWRNGQATPQDVLAALGTNAVAVFTLANLNIETVTQAAQIGGTTAPAMPTVPVGWTLTPAADGSMTATYQAPTP